MSFLSAYSSVHSRGDRPLRNRNLAITEASLQGLRLNENVPDQHLSIPPEYPYSGQPHPRDPCIGQEPSYSQLRYNLTCSPATFEAFESSQQPSSTFGASGTNLQVVEPRPSPISNSVKHAPPTTNAFTRANMSTFGYIQPPLLNNFSDPNSFNNSRYGPVQDYMYSSSEALQRRTPSTSSSASSSYASAPIDASPYTRQTPGSSQDRYLGGSLSGSPVPYAINAYQPAYGISSASTQSLYASSQPPPISSLPDMVSPQAFQSTSGSSAASVSPNMDDQVRVVGSRPKPRCFDHGCNGRQFSTFSNLLRHQREKSGSATKSYCPRCGAEFTRTTARNGHMAHEKCKPLRSSDD